MASWKITVTNKTDSKINVMIFQTVPDNLMDDSYCTAWRILQTPDPGDFDLELPSTFEFYVIEDSGRKTGPFKVSYGQAVNVSQTSASEAPAVTINTEESVPKKQIRVTNLSGNAKPLEMALFKNGSKMVFYKDIRPGDSVFMAIKSTVVMSVVRGVTQGQEFPTDSIVHGNIIMSRPVEFKLLADKPVMKVAVTEKPSLEYVFTEMP